MAEIISTGGKWKQMVGGAPKVEQLQIDRVIGLSPPSSGTVAHSPSHADILAYPAGSFAVVYNSSSRQQLRLLRSTTSNAQLGCIAWSASGEHVAAGEAGSNPAILVWDWNSSKCLAELKAHKHSVACVRFSQTDGKLLLSAGGANDGMLSIWDWKAGSVLWRQNVAAELTSAVFTEDSSCVLALGKGIFKAWSVSSTSQAGAGRGKAAAAGSSSSLSLTPRPVTLRELQGSRFVDVAVAPSPPQQPPGSNGVYALVATGVLVLMRPTGRVIDKSVNLQVRAAYALAAGATQVAAACAQGVVRLFSCKSLAFRATLPRFVARGQGPAAGAGAAAEEGFPDARACSFRPETEQQLVVVYADMSMIVWDIQDLKKITCLQTLAAHSSCIWDICPITAPVFSMAGLQQQQQQPSRCATCAADGTVRFWNLSADAPPGTGRLLPAAVDAQGRPSGQLRCMRISTDGRHICVGDQAGTLRVFDSVTLKLLLQQEAHDCEVLCLDYSPLMQGGSCLAASGSRDTLIHVFDVQAGYVLLQTLDEHSAAVTGVRFTAGGKGLVSCGADRSIIFRVLGGNSSSAAYHIETLPHSMLFDLVVDPLDQYVFTTGQDGLLRQWDVATGSLQRTLAPEAGAGEPIKLYIDSGGVVLICCHADGCLRLYHLATGQLLWRAWGHSEMVAAASLSSDLTKMVSVGGDGCVIVWKLPEQLVQEVQAAVRRVAAAKLHLDAVGQQQQGQQVPGHLDGAPSARQMAWSASPAAAGASSPGIADASPASNPGSSSTPLGTCPSSDSGMASALLRVRQGKPLVSTDKLPKWARSPSSPISGSASPAASGSGQAQQQKPLFNRWFGGRQQPSKNKWLAAQKADDGGDGACRRLSLESKSSTHDGGSENQPGAPDAAGTLHQTSSGSGQLEPQQQHEDEDDQQMPGWPQDDDMVVIQDWDDSSLAQYDDALDAATAAPPPAAGAADGAATHVTGGERVARDLFKEHFSSLGDAGPAPAPEGGSQRLRTQDLRQSLSAMFKAGRASLGGLLPLRSQPVSSAGGSSIPARHDTSSSEAYTCSTTAEAGAAASPLRVSTEDEEVHAAEKQAAAAVAAAGPPEVQPLLPPSSNGGLSAASSTSHLEDEQLPSGQASPKRRWRVGKMDAELAGMRERLASLQALYQQQMLQRQLSPRRGRSFGSTDEHMQAAQQAVTAEAREAKRGRFASDDGGLAAKALQVAVAAGSNSSDRDVVPSGKSANSSGAAAGGSKLKQEGAVDVDAAALPEQPPLPPGPVPAAALSKVAADKADPVPHAVPAPAADSTAATAPPATAAEAVAEQSQDELVSNPLYSPASAAGEGPSSPEPAAGVQAASPSLLAQLLADSPDVPSPAAARSPSIDSTATAAAAGARGVPTPLNMTAVLDAAAAAAASPGRQGSGSAPGSSCTSPALPQSPASLLQQLHASSHLSDSVYRVSIGNSITAANNSASLGGVPRSDSPTKWSLSLQVPHADAPAFSASRLSPSGGSILSRTAQTPVAAAAATDDGQQKEQAELQSTEQQQQPEPERPHRQSANGTAEAAATAEASNGLQVSDAAVREGVTITPHGQHVVWPGWGADGAWEGLTPSPGSSGVAPKLAATFDSAVTPTAAAAAEGEESGLAAEMSAISAESSAAVVVAEEPKFWLQQNPCYDMTPIGSTPGSAVASSNGRTSSWAAQVETIAEAVADVAGLPASCSSPPSVATANDSLDAQQQQQQQSEHEGQQMQQQAMHGAETCNAAHQQQQEEPQDAVQEQSLQHSQQQPAEQEQEQLPVTPVHVGAQRQTFMGSPVATPPRQSQQQDEPFFAEVQSESSFATGADSLPMSPTSSLTPPSSGKAKTRSQARREKAAAKAAAKAAKAAAAEQERQAAGLSSPGGGMMSLLQRIKRTMPSIKHRPGSGSGSSCTGGKAVSTASPVKDSPRDSSASCNGQYLSSSATSRPLPATQPFEETLPLGSWGHEVAHHHQQQQQQQQQGHRESAASDSAAGGVSLDDVCLDMVHEHAQEQGAAVLPVPEQDPGQQHSAAPQQQPARASVPADEAAVSSPAGASGAAAGRSSTAAQMAATMEQFRQSAQQMQQLWMQLQSLSLDSSEAGKLQQMLTPHKAGATATAPGADGSALTGQGSSSQQLSAEPVQLVKQMVQEEVLQTIYGLHAAVTGMPSSATGGLLQGGAALSAAGHGSPPRTPATATTASPLQPWQMHSVCSSQQQQQQQLQQLLSTPDSAGPPSCSSGAAGRASYSFGFAAAGGAAAAAAEVVPSSPALSVYSQTGVSLEALTSRICEQYTETLLQKLEERRQQKKKQERTPSPTKQQRRQAQQQQRQKQHEQEQSAAST